MKLKLTLIALLAAIFYAGAQESEKYLRFRDNPNYSEGYIITADSLKIEGLINYDEMEGVWGITFVSKDGDKKTYSLSKIKAFGNYYDNYISYNKSFYKIIQTGKKINLYKKIIVYGVTGVDARRMDGTNNPFPYKTVTGYNIKYYLRKANETDLKRVKKSKFAKRYAAYFGDCEGLRLKIINKEFTYENLEEIINDYNLDWCD